MHHPWRDLRGREHITVHWRTMPGDYLGATDGANAIWMDPDQLQVERRCTLAHEIAHIDLGHKGCQDGREEDRANRLTAQRLIEWDALVDVFRWAHTAHEAADELWVTPEVLEDRLRFLHPNEKALLALIGASRG
ncbi:ImmA/IrrE family metallo-endopeptidase [Brevibacterium casei]|nr:ImmA/IrrE family metallo-endopeptidase [Brevibacterium casei]